MKVLLVGLGSVGQRHLRNIKKLFPKTEITAFRKLNKKIYLNNSNKVIKTDLLKKYNIKLFNTYSRALDDQPDAVFICNPTSLHLDYALRAAKKKINIFVDKPLSHNLKKVSLLKKIIKKNKLLLFVGYQLRFSKPLNFIKNKISKNYLGKICGANIYNGEYLPDYHKYEHYTETNMAQKKLGGGVINTQIHEIDYCIYLFGEYKKIVSKTGQLSDLNINVEDYMNAMIFFKKDNIVVNLVLDFFQRPPIRELFITGTKKSLKWFYYKNLIEIYDYKKNKINKFYFGKFDRNQLFLDQTKYFFNLLNKKNKKNISDINNAIHALKIAKELKKNFK
jgi:predicted dehydrogenase